MQGDKLIISEKHTACAVELCKHIRDRMREQMVITVAGESGAGKSELASEIARLLTEQGTRSEVLQQDDYFVFPPKTNHEMRERNIKQVGLFEVQLGLLDSNLRSFKRRETPIYRPLVDYQANAAQMVEQELSDVRVLIAEGTYTSLLKFADLRIFIDRNYHHTAEHRQARGRDLEDSFINQVLEIEHQIISSHKGKADYIVDQDFSPSLAPAKSPPD
jgi:uridine kinase